MARWPVLLFVLGLCACGGARVEAGLAKFVEWFRASREGTASDAEPPRAP